MLRNNRATVLSNSDTSPKAEEDANEQQMHDIATANSVHNTGSVQQMDEEEYLDIEEPVPIPSPESLLLYNHLGRSVSTIPSNRRNVGTREEQESRRGRFLKRMRSFKEYEQEFFLANFLKLN